MVYAKSFFPYVSLALAFKTHFLLLDVQSHFLLSQTCYIHTLTARDTYLLHLILKSSFFFHKSLKLHIRYHLNTFYFTLKRVTPPLLES